MGKGWEGAWAGIASRLYASWIYCLSDAYSAHSIVQLLNYRGDNHRFSVCLEVFPRRNLSIFPSISVSHELTSFVDQLPTHFSSAGNSSASTFRSAQPS